MSVFSPISQPLMEHRKYDNTQTLSPASAPSFYANMLDGDSFCYRHHDDLSSETYYTQSDNGLIFANGAWSLDTYDNNYPLKPHDEPFPFNYLVNLFTAPDMEAYIAVTTFSDDVYALPIHLQRLISEAKEEVLLERARVQQDGAPRREFLTALTRLERVRKYAWLQSGGDVANLMSALTELMNDDDELETILGI